MGARHGTMAACESPKHQTEHAQAEHYYPLAGEAGDHHSRHENWKQRLSNTQNEVKYLIGTFGPQNTGQRSNTRRGSPCPGNIHKCNILILINLFSFPKH